MDKRRDAGIVTVAKTEDQPKHSPGLLIPEDLCEEGVCEEEESVTTDIVVHKTNSLMVVAMAAMFMLSIGVTAYATLLSQNNNAAAPIIVLGDDTEGPAEMTYGTKISFSEPNFFTDIKEALLMSNSSFIEADLATMELRAYKKGKEVLVTEILSKGEKGSITETPAGMYVIEEKEDLYQSPESGAFYPWSMLFQGNFYIHGQPYYDETVTEPGPYNSGGIRISDEDAQKLFGMTNLETTVLVHEEGVKSDSFVYEPKVPEVTAEHYLVADIENNAVLAGSDMDKQVPIASLTKLMSAMVAVEHLNVEDEVYLTEQQYVDTMIPRLADEDVVTVYDLLRLMLVESSNEAAEVVASVVGRDEFIDLMNDKAKSLGLEQTHFADPSGLHASNTSSLRDLLHFTQYLYNNRSFILKVTADSELLQMISDIENLNNFNDINGDDTFMAGKVGETTAAGQTSITLHRITVKDTPRVIAVIILGSSNRPGDVLQLTNYIKERFNL